ncbi:hypothetical protein FEZ08_11455 [Culicoidibacter larvae]|uniref:Uncharacterized protein n=2 Tax=Culicoidibacter larvae TaxID=2579976 RepID=A0A5R8Q744_9FIRM|nr:hypothetical protein FEZ08_11455 [Culicoidibacter larvae]
MNEKKLTLLSGKQNKVYMRILVITLLVCIVAFSSKLWLPDDRENKSNYDSPIILNRQETITFSDPIIHGQTLQVAYHYVQSKSTEAIPIPILQVKAGNKQTLEFTQLITYKSSAEEKGYLQFNFSKPSDAYYFQLNYSNDQGATFETGKRIDYRDFVPGKLASASETVTEDAQKANELLQLKADHEAILKQLEQTKTKYEQEVDSEKKEAYRLEYNALAEQANAIADQINQRLDESSQNNKE